MIKKSKRKNNGSPQIEDGYTKIADEFLEHLCKSKIMNEQSRVLLAVLRLTWGYEKKAAHIKNTAIIDLTQLSRSQVSRTLRRLKIQNVVISGNKNGYIGINKRYKQWLLTNLTTKYVDKSDNRMLTNLTTSVDKSDNPYIYIDILYKQYKDITCHFGRSKEEISEHLGEFFKKLLQREPVKLKIKKLLQSNDCKLIAVAILRFFNYHREVKKNGWKKKRGKEFNKFYDLFEQIKTKGGYKELIEETRGWNDGNNKQPTPATSGKVGSTNFDDTKLN